MEAMTGQPAPQGGAETLSLLELDDAQKADILDGLGEVDLEFREYTDGKADDIINDLFSADADALKGVMEDPGRLSRLMERLKYLEERREKWNEYKDLRVKQLKGDMDAQIEAITRSIDFVKGRMREYLDLQGLSSLVVPGVGQVVVRKSVDAVEVIDEARVIVHAKRLRSTCANLAVAAVRRVPAEGEAGKEVWQIDDLSADGYVPGVCKLTVPDFIQKFGVARPDGESWAKDCALCPWAYHKKDPTVAEPSFAACPHFVSILPDDSMGVVKTKETISKSVLKAILTDPTYFAHIHSTRPEDATTIDGDDERFDEKAGIAFDDLIDGACIGVGRRETVFMPPRKPAPPKESKGKGKGKGRKPAAESVAEPVAETVPGADVEAPAEAAPPAEG